MKRIVFLDYIRVFACFLVILVHASENFYGAPGSTDMAGPQSFLANEADRLWVSVYDGFSRMAVPLFMIVSAFLLAPFLGLPEIIAGARLCSTEQLLILATMTIPVDALFFLIGQTILRITLPILSLLCTAGIYVATNYFGVYHGYLYYGRFCCWLLYVTVFR